MLCDIRINNGKVARQCVEKRFSNDSGALLIILAFSSKGKKKTKAAQEIGSRG